MNDALCMNSFSSNKGKSFLQIKPHLVAKCADSASAGSVMFLFASIKNMLKKIKVLLHGRKLAESFELRAMSHEL